MDDLPSHPEFPTWERVNVPALAQYWATTYHGDRYEIHVLVGFGWQDWFHVELIRVTDVHRWPPPGSQVVTAFACTGEIDVEQTIEMIKRDLEEFVMEDVL